MENVVFESVPGYFVTGNLYRPLNAQPPYAAVLSTHGHYRPIAKLEDYDNHARFWPGMQARCASLARMGAVVLAIECSATATRCNSSDRPRIGHPFALTLQVWNAMRAVDFLLSLENVDSEALAVSGESGGGTQTFLLTALDPRVAVSVPVVMVSSYFFGGCACESGLPIHRSADHFVSNPMIAALAAPRPLLLVSDGKDWTQHVPQTEFPFLQKIYGYFGATANVANVHLADEGHDYGPSKRAAMYRFVADKLGLNLAAVQGATARSTNRASRLKSPRSCAPSTPNFRFRTTRCTTSHRFEQRLRSLQK